MRSTAESDDDLERFGPMTMIGVTQAKVQLSTLLDRVNAGEEIVITKRGKPVVKLTALEVPPKRHRSAPRFGFWAHYGWKLPENFDDPDPEIEALFNDGSIFPEGEKRD